MSEWIGVNVGSGRHVTDGWLSLDHSKHVLAAKVPGLAAALNRVGLMNDTEMPYHRNGDWRRVRFWDAKMPIPLPDASVQYAYSSHVLEHFSTERALGIVRDVLRVLRPGGRFRVVLPDLEQVGRAYAALQTSDTVVFRDRRITRAEWSDQVSEFCFHMAGDPFGHHVMYDRHGARRLLLRGGFSAVDDCEFRKGSVPNLDSLDLPVRAVESLYVEGVK